MRNRTAWLRFGHRHARLATWLVAGVAAGAAFCMGGARAATEASPYYLGVSETVLNDSNLHRLGDNQALPGTAASRSDTVFSTALVGGFDKNWRRQHLVASASLSNNRYSQNDHLSYNGYALNLGWDWETAGNLSGSVHYAGTRTLRRYDSTVSATDNSQNIETDHNLDLTARVGVVTRMTAVATLAHHTVDFSAPAYRASVVRVNIGSLGLTYLVGGSLTLGGAWRQTALDFPASTDSVSRSDLDLTATWRPSGLSSLQARLSRTRTEHSANQQLNFSGSTWEVQGNTMATGKLKLGTSLSHDVGLATSVFSLGPYGGTVQFNRSSTLLGFTAELQASAKTSFTANLSQLRRDLSTTDFSAPVQGSDATTTVGLGLNWQAARSTLVGCNLAYERRSAEGGVSAPYGSRSIGCSAQFIVQ